MKRNCFGKISIGIVLLMMTLVSVAISGSVVALGESDGMPTQSSFITASDDIELTENYSVSESKGITLDAGKSGLLIESKKTGSEAVGSGFSFAKELRGNFSLDFRVFSEKDFCYDKNFNAGIGGQKNSDALNPYQDLKQVTITVTDSDSGKSFDVIVSGGMNYWASSTYAAVKTGNMNVAKGLLYALKFNPEAGKGELDNYYGSTILHGTSFSNAGSGNNNNKDADGGISSFIEFEPSTMKVYARGRGAPGKILRLEVLDLSNPAHVGQENVLKKGTFERYTVSVAFTGVVENNYTDSSFTNAYERTARMIIYSLNGQELAYKNGVMEDTAGPISYLSCADLEAGKIAELKPMTFDVIEGDLPYSGNIKYYTSYDPTVRTIVYNKGYFYCPAKIGTVTFILDGIRDSSGLKGNQSEMTVSVIDYVKPVIKLKKEFPETFDVNNSESRPEVSVDDVEVILSDESKSAEVSIEVSAPNGRVYKTGLLPYTEAGEYTIKYTAVDNFGNVGELERVLKVGDFTAPEITVRAQTVLGKVGKEIDLFAVVKDVENGEDLICTLTVYKGDEAVGTKGRFTPTEAGEYKVVYSAVDSAGNEAVKEITLIIQDGKSGKGCSSRVSVAGAASVFAAVMLAALAAFFGIRPIRRKKI